MTTSNQPHVQTALRRLAARPPHAAEINDSDLPRLLRAPSVVIIWMIAMVTVIALVALSRVRVPHVVRGVVTTVTVKAAQHQETLLLLPPSARSSVRAGQIVSVDTGGAKPLTLRIASVEPEPLDVRGARSRYPASAGVLVHLASPKVAVHLDSCQPGVCLTTLRESAYSATATLGVRTLASYVVPDR